MMLRSISVHLSRVGSSLRRSGIPGAFLAVIASASSLSGQNLRTVHVEVNFPQDAVVVEREFVGPTQTLLSRVKLAVAEPVGYSSKPGFPRLPFVTRVIVLPAGSTVTDTTVTPGQQIPTQGIGLVEWAQLPWTGQGANQVPVFPTGPDGDLNFTYYAGPDWTPLDPSVLQVPAWPSAMAELADSREVSGHVVLVYRIDPVQWLPQQDILTSATSISLDVRYVPGPLTQPHNYAEAMDVEHLKSIAANPQDVIGIKPHAFPPGPDTRYLVITDNFHWQADMTRGASAGNMADEFRRLAQWKTEKGVKASVVTITNIYNGKYGDFRTGARDLPEVIRNFLKYAHTAWSTYWVLIGGDFDVVPARQAIGNIGIHDHYIWRGDKPEPDEFNCYWDSASKSLRIRNSNNGDGIFDCTIGIETLIVAEKSGKAFGRVARIPSADDPGWIYTDPSYSGDTRIYSDNIFLRGPEADLVGTDFYSVQPNNSIPTDLYYGSLDGPRYGLPGLHDWDANDNGLYGQYNSNSSDAIAQIDGVNLCASVAVGRAPVSSQAEAKTFVDKVLAYERFEGASLDFARRLLLTADNWYDGPAVAAGGADPPEEGLFCVTGGGNVAKLHFKAPPGGKSYRLFGWNETGWYWQVPYNPAASASSLGYFFCTKEDYATPSVSGSSPPMAPTRYVKVVGPSAEVNPKFFFFNTVGADPAMDEKEAVKKILATWAPGLDLRKRLYKDIQDAPGYLTDPDLSELSGDKVHSALDEGYNIVSMSGHGYWTGCCGMSISWVPSLTNGFAGGVVYAESCLTNEFEEPKADGSTSDAVSERFLTSAGGGAVAYIGNSRYSIIGVGPKFEEAFWVLLAAGGRLGNAFRSKWIYNFVSDDRWVNYTLNLLGDPEMPVWMGEPKDLAVSHPASVFQGDPLPVQVNAPGGVPLEGALVCVTGPEDFIEIEETGPTGGVSFSIAGRASGDVLKVTVTAGGYIPYQGTAEVKILIKRADSNLDGVIDISDAMTIFNHLFLGTAQLDCMDAADANGDGGVDISDGVTILQFLFLGGEIKTGAPSCP